MTDKIAGRRRGLKLGALTVGGFLLLPAYFLPVAKLGAGGVGIGSIPVCVFPVFAVIILWEGPTQFSAAFLAGSHLFTQAFVIASGLVLLIRRRQWCFMTARLWVTGAGLVFLATLCLLFFPEPIGVGALLLGVGGPVFGVGVMLHLRRHHQHCFSDSDGTQPDVQADGEDAAAQVNVVREKKTRRCIMLFATLALTVVYATVSETASLAPKVEDTSPTDVAIAKRAMAGPADLLDPPTESFEPPVELLQPPVEFVGTRGNAADWGGNRLGVLSSKHRSES